MTKKNRRNVRNAIRILRGILTGNEAMKSLIIADYQRRAGFRITGR